MSTQHKTQTGQPLMEMGHNMGRLLTLSCVLQNWTKRGQYWQKYTYNIKPSLFVCFTLSSGFVFQSYPQALQRSCADYLLSLLLYTAETFNSSAAHPQHFLGNSYHYSLTSPRSQAVRKPKSTASLASRSNQGTPISQSSHNSLFQVSRDHAVNPTSIRITYGLPSMSHRPK